IEFRSDGSIDYNIPTSGVAHYFQRNGSIIGGFRSGEMWTNGVISTEAPYGSQAGQWRLGRALVGAPTPDRSIRVQIGDVVLDIAAQYVTTIIS
ncbi:hypothetical protein RZS08_47065, partial [Arthrospira platensis SPKY1]|nr:hypothetical protein [Arthrospira platensis SPKY1]